VVFDPITDKEVGAEELCDLLKEAIKEEKKEKIDHYMRLLIKEVAPLTV